MFIGCLVIESVVSVGTSFLHLPFGHLLPQQGRAKAKMIIAFSRFFQREKVPEGRMSEDMENLTPQKQS
jgi:hypothetical protein